MRFSYSSIRKWYHCEQAWAFAYVDRLTPIRSRKAFDIGKYVHALMEYALLGHARTGTAAVLDQQVTSTVCRKLAKTDGLELDEGEAVAGLEAARGALIAMNLDQWTTVVLPDGTPCVELTIKTAWRGHELEARIDWIATSEVTGKTYIIDHKTTRYAIDDSPGVVEFSLQNALYSEACKSIPDLKIDGCLHNVIRVPKKTAPIELKSGKLSRDKNKNAMPWPLYKRAILERDEDPADYDDMREALESRAWHMWRPDRTSEVGRMSMLHYAQIALQRMEYSVPHNSFLVARVPENKCTTCEYRELCYYHLDGQDIRPLLDVAFKVRDEDSPWHDQANFADATDYFARVGRTGRFDVSGFIP